MAKDGMSSSYRDGREITKRQPKPIDKKELLGLKQVYESQYLLAATFEAAGQSFTPTDPRLERAIIGLNLPDIRTKDGRQAYAELLEQRKTRSGKRSQKI